VSEGYIAVSAPLRKSSLRFLVVEDNQDIAENIGDYLESSGHIIDYAFDGIGGLHLALTSDYDAIVLDVMLPGIDGLTFCRRLREDGKKATPILMLTARDTLSDKLKGFKAGTDDYLVKPFALEEMGVRLEVLVRRFNADTRRCLQVADLVLNPGSMRVERGGMPIELNRACFKILTILMQAFPNVVSRQALEDVLWGDMLPGSDALRSHIYSLRRSIDKPFGAPLLQTVHGVGYRLVNPNEISP
jgi:DNA-binding response OmpR family regulator